MSVVSVLERRQSPASIFLCSWPGELRLPKPVQGTILISEAAESRANVGSNSLHVADQMGRPEIIGSCLCGAVRYTATVSPVLVGVCHCRDCQKFTGSAFGFLVGVPRNAFELRGTVKSYRKPADSGRPIVRRFCPECGSSIAEEPGSRPDLIILNGGTLHDPNFADAGDADLLRPRVILGAAGRQYAMVPEMPA